MSIKTLAYLMKYMYIKYNPIFYSGTKTSRYCFLSGAKTSRLIWCQKKHQGTKRLGPKRLGAIKTVWCQNFRLPVPIGTKRLISTDFMQIDSIETASPVYVFVNKPDIRNNSGNIGIVLQYFCSVLSLNVNLKRKSIFCSLNNMNMSFQVDFPRKCQCH